MEVVGGESDDDWDDPPDHIEIAGSDVSADDGIGSSAEVPEVRRPREVHSRTPQKPLLSFQRTRSCKPNMYKFACVTGGSSKAAQHRVVQSNSN